MDRISNIGEECFTRGDFSESTEVAHFAELMARDMPVAVDNDTVFAIWGNGRSETFKRGVDAAKEREPNRTYGLSIDSEEFLPLVDRDRLPRHIHPLFDDAEVFDGLLGAISFVRVPARRRALEAGNVPSAVISYAADAARTPVIQNWSPAGKHNVHHLLHTAKHLEGDFFATVTSLNLSKQPEITTLQTADTFSTGRLPLLTDEHATRKLQGSFPIVTADEEGLTIIRTRARGVGTRLLSGLLHGYDVHEATETTLNPGRHFEELRGIRGAELRQGLLETLGWSNPTPVLASAPRKMGV